MDYPRRSKARRTNGSKFFRRSSIQPRKPRVPMPWDTRALMIETMHGYMVEVWGSLSARQKAGLGFVPTSKESAPEEGMTFLAYVLIDCVNITLDQAASQRRARLGWLDK